MRPRPIDGKARGNDVDRIQMTTPANLCHEDAERISDAIDKFEDLVLNSGAARIFLIGAGCSYCAGLPLTMDLTSNVLENGKLNETAKNILSKVKDSFDGGAGSHIEDYLSEIIDLLAIAERRASRGVVDTKIQVGDGEFTVDQIREAVENIKRAIANSIDQPLTIDTHRQFVGALHRPMRGDLRSGRERVDYLILNYDTAIEDALGLEEIPYADGIDGGATGPWNPETFDREGLAARVFKLHGSIDWSSIEGRELPFRVSPKVHVASPEDRNVLIWPASTKYKEAQLDPYAQLIDRAREVLRPMSDRQTVLVVCGYSFGDQHINEEIDTALRVSNGNLTLVAFTSDDTLVGQLQKWNEDPTVREQVLIFADKGFFHGEEKFEIDGSIGWWRFEEITRLLGGER